MLHFATAQDNEQLPAAVIPGPATCAIATETVDFFSALQVAASVAPVLQIGKFGNPIALSTDAPNKRK